MAITWHLFKEVLNNSVWLCLVTLALWACYTWRKRSPNSPPGTNGIPLLGSVFSIGRYPERTLQALSKKYGPLYMIRFGFKDILIIGSAEIAYEAFAKNDCFNDRPDTIPTIEPSGILMINSSDFHKEQRRFGLNTLREFGMGRKSLESPLLEISNELCDKINNLCGPNGKSKPFDPSRMVFESISCVICRIIFGYDMAKENEKFHKLTLQLIEPSVLNFLGSILVMAPFLRFLPLFARAWSESMAYGKQLNAEISKEVIEHQRTRDPSNPRDFIDCFLEEMEKANIKSEHGKANSFNNQKNAESRSLSESEVKVEDYSSEWTPKASFTTTRLISVCRDLFIAGTETTSTSILWIILYLSKYPDVQKRMQEEIDNVLGQSGQPRMALMEKLPYVRAVIQETARIRPVVPLSVPHLASRDGILKGYRIPKGAMLLTNTWAIHHDEQKWPNPEEFLPERHLDEDGKFVKSPNWISFNVGLRSCLGQQLAKMELCISIITLFRRFEFALPEGYNPDMRGESKISLHPWHYNVIASRR